MEIRFAIGCLVNVTEIIKFMLRFLLEFAFTALVLEKFLQKARKKLKYCLLYSEGLKIDLHNSIFTCENHIELNKKVINEPQICIVELKLFTDHSAYRFSLKRTENILETNRKLFFHSALIKLFALSGIGLNLQISFLIVLFFTFRVSFSILWVIILSAFELNDFLTSGNGIRSRIVSRLQVSETQGLSGNQCIHFQR